MTGRQYVDRARVVETGRPPAVDALLLGGLLAAGLTVAVPLLSLTTPVPTLVWVGLVGLCYGLTAVAIGRVTVGVYAALLVTMTFAANVPLASGDYLLSMTRDLGPNVWLAHLPLVALLGLLALADRERFVEVSRAEWLLGGFVGWVVLAAVVSRPVRVDAALYFALFVLWGGLVFGAVRRAHRVLPVTPKTTLSILAVTVLFKSGFAIVEAVNGDSFGLTQLGELSADLAVTIATIPLGSVSIPVGTYVSGFSGMSFLLASLGVLLVPFVLSLSLEREPRLRLAGGLAALVVAFAIRLTGTDAGRGAALLALSLFVGWIGVRWWSSGPSRQRRRWLVVFLLVAAACVGLLLLPSTQSGASGSVASGSVASAPSGSVGGGESPSTGAESSDVSVPLFDLSNLGVRFQQYAAGLSLFLAHPLFGIGGANFPYLASAYGIPGNLPIHNVYISLLAETGAVGFALYVGFLLAVLRRGVRAVTSDALDAPVRVAALAGVVGYLAFMFWDHMVFNSVVSSFTFYAVCATVVADSHDD